MNETKKTFQKAKIKTLNKFFMKSIYIEFILIFSFFLLSIIILFLLTNFIQISIEFKITMLSITITYITSTSKAIIDKIIMLAEYKTELLIEEQRGLNKTIGVEVEKTVSEYQKGDEHYKTP